jgi:ubiquinone/menaquinone biosynthesis C-methylase UbiE
MDFAFMWVSPSSSIVPMVSTAVSKPVCRFSASFPKKSGPKTKPKNDYWEKVSWERPPDTSYATSMVLQPDFERWVPKTARILDVGCGQARSLQFLAQSGYKHLEGIDYNASAIEAAKSQCLALPAGLRPELKVANSDKLPYPDKAFDAIFNQAFWNCFIKDSERLKTLQEIRRILKPGGIYYLEEFGYTPSVVENAQRYSAGEAKGYPRGTFDVTDAQGRYLYTSHHYEKPHLEKLFKDSGFDILDYRSLRAQTRTAKPNTGHLFVLRKAADNA